MKIELSNALTLTINTGRHGGRPADAPPSPIVILGYPRAVTEALVTGVLRKHAQPEDMVVGYYRDTDGRMTIGCYLVVAMPKPNNTLYIIGNTRAMPDWEWNELHERFGEFGHTLVTCGSIDIAHNRAFLTEPPWFMACSTIHRQNIIPLLTDTLVKKFQPTD